MKYVPTINKNGVYERDLVCSPRDRTPKESLRDGLICLAVIGLGVATIHVLRILFG